MPTFAYWRNGSDQVFNIFAYILNGQSLEICRASYFWYYFFKSVFTPCKDEQTLWGMDLQEKEEEIDEDEKHIGKLFSKNMR